jgi:hypothetical protein
MAKLRAIDQGTRYDVTGCMRGLIRRIERGEINPSDVLILTREVVKPYSSSCRVGLHHYGPGTIEQIHWMLTTAKNRIEPA